MLLELRLNKTVGNFRLDCECALSSDRTGIFGPSGSGKSTLMHLLAGLSSADSGTIRLDGETLFDRARRIDSKPEQRRIGVVFQHAHLFPHMSVRRNLLYGYRRTRAAERRIRPETLFEVLGIEPLLERDVTTLSGGERQRVALARTVLTCPRLILMDEPLNGLDEHLKFQIIPYLKRVFSEFKIPLIFISHSMLEMRMMTEEVLVMEQGSIRRRLATESLARSSWEADRQGYVNLLSLGRSRPHRDLFSYPWGDTALILTEPGEQEENLFELDAREIILFKRHPETTSARNLLECRVSQLYRSGNRVRVELGCGNSRLIAQIVPEAVRELEISQGSRLVAAIKASAFKRIF
ncbi:molybdenum ABC transporter ATP-binding protein [Desulfogranum mediterraneum]|uniref:molybdenum ABC transporter ATP-binding protein n=1 Tax=Desulfogranum mediterraneum TaxID=160661 RepID=UPI0003FF15EB|nr:molybdenum ABC transporter ATP-binding protein [Desulfogranum mediterraneum]